MHKFAAVDEDRPPAPAGGTLVSASFPRRLGAMFYDTLLLLALLFVAAIPLPLIPAETRENFWIEWLIRGYLLAVIGIYLVGSWRSGGQTLGMRTWRLRVVDRHGTTPETGALLIRFAASILSWVPAGAGFLWILCNRRREAFHDRVSGTYVVLDREGPARGRTTS